MKKILIIILNLFNKKKTVLLSDFYDKVEKVAKEHGEKYFTVDVEMSSNHGDDIKYTYKSYINNFGHSFGPTMKESIDGLVSQKKEVKNKDFTVVI